ncbi:FISUMP domain-containing protein [Chryseobacterium nematophagum]|nr:FISUMP domain-containing protein [Chryseobacterium nematophagum]
MRKTNLLVCMLLGVVSFGQIGINNPSPKATLEITAKKTDGSTSEGVIPPRLTGNALFAAIAAGTYGPNQYGAVVFVTAPADEANRVGQTVHVDDFGFYYYHGDLDQWVKLGSGSTIYRTDGILTGPRHMTMDGNNLGFTGGRIGMGIVSPNPSAILDLTSTQTGFLFPRMLKTEMNAIANPAYGLFVFCTDCFNNSGCLMVNDSQDPGVPNWGSLCSSNIATGHIADLQCTNAVTAGVVHSGVALSGVSFTVPYTGGNGGTYPTASFNSTGVTGLAANLDGGSLVNGNGNLVFTITGIASAAGTASFNITVGEQSCTVTVEVDDFTASVVSLECTTATLLPNALTQGEAYTGTLTVPYTGGNGALYPQQSFTQNGLTFTLPSGTLATGNGNFVYNVTGSATASGAMLIPISFGSTPPCNVSTTVSPGTTVAMCMGNGTTRVWMAHNLGADTSLDPNPTTMVSSGLHGNYYQWGKKDPVANVSTPLSPIVGWDTVGAPIGSWGAVKTANDPCPTGFRIPANIEWNSLINNTTRITIGTFSNNGNGDPSNFTAAAVLTCGNSKLTFPANGYRRNGDGSLNARASMGSYWSCTETTVSYLVQSMYFSSTGGLSVSADYKPSGLAIRCISE